MGRAAAKVVGEAGALALGHKRIISSPSDVEKKAEAAAKQERQQAFFTDQNAMRDAMKQVAKAASHWEDSQWFFLFRPADDETHCLSELDGNALASTLDGEALTRWSEAHLWK